MILLKAHETWIALTDENRNPSIAWDSDLDQNIRKKINWNIFEGIAEEHEIIWSKVNFIHWDLGWINSNSFPIGKDLFKANNESNWTTFLEVALVSMLSTLNKYLRMWLKI